MQMVIYTRSEIANDIDKNVKNHTKEHISTANVLVLRY